MPPKGWKKPDRGAAVGGAIAGAAIGGVATGGIATGGQAGMAIAQQFPQPTQNIPQMQQERPAQSPGARKSGLAANLDQPTQERIAAVNEVTVMCKGGLGRFDFKALWLKQFPDAIPVGELTPRLKSAVLAADEIWINCKMKRPNDPEVTLNHSRHNALWLKEYV